MPFSEQTLDFLFENRMRDDRLWFNEHRPDYERLVLEPLRQLVSDMAPAMLSIDSQLIVEPKVGKCISRIFRDTRFSHDKSIFRDVMWISFERDKNYPGFYFEITPTSYSYGCGWYCATAKEADALHSLVLSGTPQFRAAQEAFSKQSVFSFEGDRYKRPRHPEISGFKSEWLERRSPYITVRDSDKAVLFSPDLARKLSDDFLSVADVYKFIIEAHAFSRV